jgi:hypothetical protein
MSQASSGGGAIVTPHSKTLDRLCPMSCVLCELEKLKPSNTIYRRNPSSKKVPLSLESYLYAPPSVQEQILFEIRESRQERIVEMSRKIKKFENIINGNT